MNDLKRASIIHQLITSGIKITAGMKYVDIYSDVLSRINNILKVYDKSKGLAFPVGISVNEIAAHDSAFSNLDNRIIPEGAVVKLDIGIHYNGRIIDCARTFDLSGTHDKLVQSTITATKEAIKMFRPDTHIIDISEKISEIISSYDGIKPMYGIGGHSIEPWNIHSGILIPCVPNYSDCKMKILANTQYAVETFASTGSGKTIDIVDIPISHFMIRKKNPDSELLMKIWNLRKTLPFSPYDCPFILNDKIAFKRLQNDGYITKFVPLGDRSGTFTSQHEETIYVGESVTEILTSNSFS